MAPPRLGRISTMVEAPLVAAGFVRSGSTFRRMADSGDQAIVSLGRASDWHPVIAFQVEGGVVLHRERPWMPEEIRASLPPREIHHAEFRFLLRPPEQFSYYRLTGVPVDALWAFPDEVGDLGVLEGELKRGVVESVLPPLDAALAGERSVPVLTAGNINPSTTGRPFRLRG